MVGNVPTEEVLQALQRREVRLAQGANLGEVEALNRAITAEFSAVVKPE
jgi:hypothetical protein